LGDAAGEAFGVAAVLCATESAEERNARRTEANATGSGVRRIEEKRGMMNLKCDINPESCTRGMR